MPSRRPTDLRKNGPAFPAPCLGWRPELVWRTASPTFADLRGKKKLKERKKKAVQCGLADSRTQIYGQKITEQYMVL